MSSPLSSPCPIHRHAQVRPESLALWTPRRCWTYGELNVAIGATQAQLRRGGIRVGTRVALRLDRGPAFVVLLWALWREGSVAVPLSSRLPPERVQKALERVRADHLVTRERALLDGPVNNIDVHPPEVLVEKEQGRPKPSVQPLGRPATVVFTSGSTGAPKAVLHSWANHLYSAKGSNANIPLRRGDRWLLSLPLYHVGGIAVLVRCALAGAAVALPEREASLATSLEASGATHASLVATQLRRLLNAGDGGPPDTLRALLLGGGPLPASLLRRGYRRGWPLHASYGSTEMASQVTTTSPGASLDTLLTAGRCLPHRRVRIAENGQILVAGPTLCLGVLGEDGRQDPRVDRWYPTGDLGRVDASGRLRVEGRVDRQFVSGGENIQPEEIEAALEQIDGVERAVVVPVPDEEYGRRPVGFVQVKSEARPAEWRSALASQLPCFKIPDGLFELPEAAIQGRMKVDRDHLRQEAQRAMTSRKSSSSVE